MNRICLKRKQAQKKTIPITLTEQQLNQNIQIQKPQKLSDVSNSPSMSKVTIQDTNTNQRMFQQFKIQYDQLRTAYQTQRSSYDLLLQEKKRLQIQILNNNPEFYEKEIKRLRGEVEKLQEENEDYKHKFIVAENAKKELQATVKVRNEQLKKTLQLIQKQKVSCVQLKHQLSQKQKFFQRITSQMEKSNGVLSQSFEQANLKIQKLQFNLKSKTHDLQGLQRNYDHMAKKLTQTQKAMKGNKQIFDQTNTKKTQIIDQLQTKLRNVTRSSRDTIQSLQGKLQQLKNHRKTENLLVEQQIENKKSFMQHSSNQLQIVRLEENNKQLKLDLEAKCKLIKDLQERLLGSCTLQEYQELEKKYKQLQENMDQKSKNYEQRLIMAQKQLQNQKLNQFRNPAVQDGITNDFQQLLKAQIQQNAKVKRQLSFKIDQVYNTKADLQDLKCKLRANQDQITILNKKIKSQQKNHKIEVDVSSQNMKNQLDSLKRKLDMAQVKIEQKNKEIKEKENFIANTIIGRSKQEDAALIIAEVQRVFEADYVTRLCAAQAKIEEYEKGLRRL